MTLDHPTPLVTENTHTITSSYFLSVMHTTTSIPVTHTKTKYLIHIVHVLYCPGQAPTHQFYGFSRSSVQPPTTQNFYVVTQSSQFELMYTIAASILMSFRRHYTRQEGLHTPVVASSAVFLACSTKFAYCKRRTLRSPGNETSGWFVF